MFRQMNHVSIHYMHMYSIPYPLMQAVVAKQQWSKLVEVMLHTIKVAVKKINGP